MSGSVTVFVNGARVRLSASGTALDAVRAADAAAAEAIEAGKRGLTDSRGLPLSPGARVYAGAIYRIVSARAAASDPTT